MLMLPLGAQHERERKGGEEEDKNTYFLGRRDVVDIGPERQRHGEHIGQFDTVTKKRRHSRRTAVS